MVNPGVTGVTATVELYATDGALPDVLTVPVEPDTPARVPIADGAGAAVGARVSATGPIAASVVARGEAGTAVTAGAPEPARQWLVPGVRTVGLEEGTLWILNTDESAISVTVGQLSSGVPVGETLVIDAGTIRSFPAADGAGYLVESSAPVSVAWSLEGPSGIAFVGAAAVPEDD
jgi:hypothetical protein